MGAKGSPTRPLLVYLIDDEPEVAWALSDVLRQTGCEVKTFLSGVDLLADRTGRAPDLVVTDFVMQPVDGLRVAAWVRQTYPGARILMITADEQLVRRAEGRHLPFRVMEKPLTSADLIAAVYGSEADRAS
jgi:CheY-like chemotaxis protein